MKNRIIEVLMNRDGMSKAEACKRLNEVRQMIHESGFGSYDEIEDIMYSELGLEMDYIDDILF